MINIFNSFIWEKTTKFQYNGISQIQFTVCKWHTDVYAIFLSICLLDGSSLVDVKPLPKPMLICGQLHYKLDQK